MTRASLGRLRKVDLRQVWTSEPAGFTPWLASEENLKLLGETIGIDLAFESQEKGVGPFRADILCRDTTTEEFVLIENQLERTDHSHLGQLLTYAAGLQAVTIVWIAERFTEEHRAALDWLNERTDSKINLFGLEIELWQIGESAIAPKFNIISQPNEWARNVHDLAGHGAEVGETKLLQLKYWTAFHEYLTAQGSPLRLARPGPHHWTQHALGLSGVYLSSCVSSRSVTEESGEPEVRAELVLTSPRSKEHFAILEARRSELEGAVGGALTWHNPTAKRMCRIFIRRPSDFTQEQDWPRQFEWLRQQQEAFQRWITPVLPSLRGE
jgi:hypothetical protein